MIGNVVFSKDMNKLENLEKLEVNIDFSNQIGISGIKNLAAGIKNNLNLKFLKIQILGQNAIHFKSMLAITQAIGSLTNLRVLWFEINFIEKC